MCHASNGNCPPRDARPVVMVIAASGAGTDCAERKEGLGLTEDVNGAAPLGRRRARDRLGKAFTTRVLD
jgi:hypothetical protein